MDATDAYLYLLRVELHLINELLAAIRLPAGYRHRISRIGSLAEACEIVEEKIDCLRPGQVKSALWRFVS